MKPLPTWEEIASRVTVEGGTVRVVDLRKAIGANATMRITGLAGGVISLEQLRFDHHYVTTTETLRGASLRVGVSMEVLRRALRRAGHISIHDGRKGMHWHRIPIGVADRIAADRRGAP